MKDNIKSSISMKTEFKIRKSVPRVPVEVHFQRNGFTFRVTPFTLPYQEFMQAVLVVLKNPVEKQSMLRFSIRELIRNSGKNCPHDILENLIIQFLISHDIVQRPLEERFKDLGFLITVNVTEPVWIRGIITTRSGLRALESFTFFRPDLDLACEEITDCLLDSGNRFYLFAA